MSCCAGRALTDNHPHSDLVAATWSKQHLKATTIIIMITFMIHISLYKSKKAKSSTENCHFNIHPACSIYCFKSDIKQNQSIKSNLRPTSVVELVSDVASCSGIELRLTDHQGVLQREAC